MTIVCILLSLAAIAWLGYAVGFHLNSVIIGRVLLWLAAIALTLSLLGYALGVRHPAPQPVQEEIIP